MSKHKRPAARKQLTPKEQLQDEFRSALSDLCSDFLNANQDDEGGMSLTQVADVMRRCMRQVANGLYIEEDGSSSDFYDKTADNLNEDMKEGMELLRIVCQHTASLENAVKIRKAILMLPEKIYY